MMNAATLPNGARAAEFVDDRVGAKTGEMLREDFEHYATDIGSTGQGVFQEFPDGLGDTPVMCIHPEAVLPRTARDVDLRHAVESEAVDAAKGSCRDAPVLPEMVRSSSCRQLPRSRIAFIGQCLAYLRIARVIR